MAVELAERYGLQPVVVAAQGLPVRTLAAPASRRLWVDPVVSGFPRVEEGELWWPERIDSESLGQMKRVLGSYGAAGQSFWTLPALTLGAERRCINDQGTFMVRRPREVATPSPHLASIFRAPPPANALGWLLAVEVIDASPQRAVGVVPAAAPALDTEGWLGGAYHHRRRQ